MNYKKGMIFSIIDDNKPVKGCTISNSISEDISVYSLSNNSDISKEIYPYYKMLIVSYGDLKIYYDDSFVVLNSYDCIICPKDVSYGFKSENGAIYTEIILEGSEDVLDAGKIFSLKDLLDYQDGKIVNMDIFHNDKMKFVLMAFDKGCELKEHKTSAEVLLFILDGEVIIGYEGKEHHLKENENFSFAKGGLHYIKASEKFKMALLMVSE